MFFVKCEKNKALKTEIGCLNEKMRKMKKELQWKDYQFEQLNHDIDEIIFEKIGSWRLYKIANFLMFLRIFTI